MMTLHLFLHYACSLMRDVCVPQILFSLKTAAVTVLLICLEISCRYSDDISKLMFICCDEAEANVKN